MTMESKVAVVVVTYNCGKDLGENLKSYVDDVALVIIVDNGSDKATVHGIQQCQFLYGSDRIAVHLNAANVGIAKAQNIGIELAMQRGVEWVLLLDHDSRGRPGMLHNLFRHAAQADADVGIVAPQIFDINIKTANRYLIKRWGPFFKRIHLVEDMRTDVLSVFSSGSMIRVSVLKKLGLMREDFFIDFVDTEFCLRCITAGYRVMVVRDAVLLHQLGRREHKRVAGISFRPTHHPAIRKYYLARNRTITWKLYWRAVPAYLAFDTGAAALDLMRIIFFEADRVNKLKLTVIGYWHALLGRTGTYRR